MCVVSAKLIRLYTRLATRTDRRAKFRSQNDKNSRIVQEEFETSEVKSQQRRADANTHDDDGGRVRSRVVLIRRCSDGAKRFGGSGEERRVGTWRVCRRLELVEDRSIAESQRFSGDDCGEPSHVIR